MRERTVNRVFSRLHAIRILLVVLGLFMAIGLAHAQDKPISASTFSGKVKKKWSSYKTIQYDVKLQTDLGYGAKTFNEKCFVQKRNARTECVGEKSGSSWLIIETGKERWLVFEYPKMPEMGMITWDKAGGAREGRESLFGIATSHHEANDPATLLKVLMKHYTLAKTTMEKSGDKDVYVVNGTLKKSVITKEESVPEDESRMDFINTIRNVRLVFNKESLHLLEYAVYGESIDEPTKSVTCSNYVINAKLDKEAFVYEPPEGASVTDLTKEIEEEDW